MARPGRRDERLGVKPFRLCLSQEAFLGRWRQTGPTCEKPEELAIWRADEGGAVVWLKRDDPIIAFSSRRHQGGKTFKLDAKSGALAALHHRRTPSGRMRAAIRAILRVHHADAAVLLHRVVSGGAGVVTLKGVRQACDLVPVACIAREIDVGYGAEGTGAGAGDQNEAESEEWV